MNNNISGYSTGIILYCDISGKKVLKEIQKEFPLIKGIATGNVLVLSKYDSDKKQLEDFSKQYLK